MTPIPDFTSPEYTAYDAAPSVPDFADPEYTAYQEMPPRPDAWGWLRDMLGSGVRGVFKGALALPSLVTDPVTEAINAAVGAQIPGAAQSVDRAADSLGVPRASDRSGDFAETMGGAIGGVGGTLPLLSRAAQTFKTAAGPIARGAGEVFRAMAADPKSQVAASLLGAEAAHATKELGGGPGWQMGAATLAGMAVPVVGTVGEAIDSAATRGGQRDTAAQAFRALTTEPEYVPQRINEALAEAGSIPGFRPMTAPASRDPGLLAIHNTVRSLASPAFMAAESANNQALRGYLESRFGPERAALIAKRDTELAGRIVALERNRRPTNPTPFLAELDALEMVPRGQGPEVGKVIEATRKAVDEVFNRGGYDWLTDPSYLYNAVRKPLDAMIDSAMTSEGTRLTSNAIAVAKKIRRSLDDVIEEGMPGYRDYWMRPFAKMSAAADRREILDDILSRSSATAQADLRMEPMLQASAFERAMRSAEKTLVNRYTTKAQSLTPGQRETLANVRRELQRGAMLGLARTAGSDTFRNLTMGALVGRLVSGGGLGKDAPAWVQTIADRIPIGKLFGADKAALDYLAEALLDPEMAKHLLVRANELSADSLMVNLTKRIGAAQAGAAQVE